MTEDSRTLPGHAVREKSCPQPEKDGLRVTFITGQQGSGKTAWAKKEFPERTLVSCRSVKAWNLAKNSPQAFFELYGKTSAVTDCELAPELLDFLTEKPDAVPFPVILLGNPRRSQIERLCERLGGAAEVIEVSPYGNPAFEAAAWTGTEPNAKLAGFYAAMMAGKLPALADEKPQRYWADWLTELIDLVAGKILRTGSPNTFYRFMKTLAEQAGQEINFSETGRACGVSSVTAKAWAEALEDARVIRMIRPLKTPTRRPVKHSRMIFSDTGLALYLSDVIGEEQLRRHGNLRGFVLNEIASSLLSESTGSELFYFRDSNKVEIDLVEVTGKSCRAVSAAIPAELHERKLKQLRILSEFGLELRAAILVCTGEPQQMKSSPLPVRTLELT